MSKLGIAKASAYITQMKTLQFARARMFLHARHMWFEATLKAFREMLN